MANSVFNLKKDLELLAKKIPTKVIAIIATEGSNHFESSFDNQGFTDNGVKKWDKRKTTDTRGRDLTRYRTNRVGRAGGLSQFGRRNQGRNILVGHNSNTGLKLKDSIRLKREPKRVVFFTNKAYAKRHNEGLKGMPQRQFMGQSKQLDQKISNKLKGL